MRKLMYILLAVSILFGVCGYEGDDESDKTKTNIQHQSTNNKMKDKEIEEIILS
ncbi:MAG: hypothetical protein NC489_21785 [Ruminococcus flavefaciens]|nr:hypothetical protein [Ruminococcus flavefaciens]